MRWYLWLVALPDAVGYVHQSFRIGIVTLMLLRAAERHASQNEKSQSYYSENWGYVNRLKSLIGID